MKGKAFTRGYLDNHVFGQVKESAEVIIAIGNEPRIETVEVSPDSEGLNIKMFQIKHRSAIGSSYAISGTEQTKKLFYILMNRRVRDPYARWCEGFSARLLA